MKKPLVIIMIAVFLFAGFLSAQRYPHWMQDTLASLILVHNTRLAEEIKARYDKHPRVSKVRILLVPGHEPDYGGTEYLGLKERDMVVELAKELEQFLQKDKHFEVSVTRDTERWNPDLSAYFTNHWNTINEWKNTSRDEYSKLLSINSTSTVQVSKVLHNRAPTNVALRLYGITKWANESTIDIVLHIHFNDNRGRAVNKPGVYSGFAIYVPADQYFNSATTKAIANPIFKRLADHYPVSNLPGESSGIVDEPELIAIGSNNTADAASMLIEYSYIYEPQFTDPTDRSRVIKDMAFQTYLGLDDFFNAK